MMTLIAVALVAVVVLVMMFGVGVMISDMVKGCPLAWLWFLMGGLEATGKLMGTLAGLLGELITSMSE